MTRLQGLDLRVVRYSGGALGLAAMSNDSKALPVTSPPWAVSFARVLQ
jgi:hypothetical protein